MMENGSYSSSSEASSISSIATSDDVEVRKLKDLVKKLEKQNEHLRHRTGKLSSNANKLSKHKSGETVAGGDAFTNHSIPKPTRVNGFNDDNLDFKTVDETDPVVRSVLYGDQFTWLYQSPKASSREEDDGKHYSSPVQWLNEEFESPSTPQLASARKNILYKIGLIDRASPDLSYLTQSVEKRLLFHPDDFKMEDPTDVKVAARLQQEELNRTRATAISNDVVDSFPINNNHRRGSYGDDGEISPGSTQYAHHLPVPSQTMTTAHGLYPAHFDNDTAGSRGRKPHTSTNSSSVGSSPRNKSPARSRQAKSPSRRSLPNPSRTSSSSSISSGRSSSPLRASQPAEMPRESDKTHTYNGTSQPQQPAIRSSLVAPGRMSRLQQKSGLPAPGSSKGIPTTARSISAPRAASPMTSQRRSLPRPSQTPSTMRYTSSKLSNPSNSRPSSTVSSPRAPNPASSGDVWGDEEVY